MLNSKIVFRAAAVVAPMLLGACTTLPVTTDYNPVVGIGVCHTYAWATEHYNTTSPAAFANPLNGERLRSAIEANLNARGLRPAAEHTHADCLVGYAIGSRLMADQFGDWRVGYGYGYGWRRGWGGWAGWGPYDAPVYNEGRISVDIFDVKSHTPIWHATVESNAGDLTGSDAAARINAAAAAIFTKFPIAAPPVGSQAST